MEYVNGMTAMVMKAGMALFMSCQSMRAALTIMSAPVRIKAGPVQYVGMLAKILRMQHNTPLSY